MLARTEIEAELVVQINDALIDRKVDELDEQVQLLLVRAELPLHCVSQRY